ncbi:TetR family transcriptional regulator [Actinomadura hibisca]|uniref:TetR family transcriptional regulator n=1 Tax=Actinomadura hibisca TaxID=68565 RepID=UPI000A6A7415|nr:TetR family transcriptional regulator [Actinomadura hibisca]
MKVAEGRRERKVTRTRRILAEAALGLVRERGFDAVTVQEIAEHADVSRRTFSRHFAGIDDALVEPLRVDFVQINDALALRPVDEPPLLAYRNAVAGWLARDDAWHRRDAVLELFRLMAERPALLEAFHRVGAVAEDETVVVLAARMGVGRDDLRPAVLAAVGAGALRVGVRVWWSAPGLDLPVVVARAFDALLGEQGVHLGG